MRWKLRYLVPVSVTLAALIGAAELVAFPAEDDDTPGSQALRFGGHSNVWGSAAVGVMDGKVVTSPPDSTKYDRRVEGLVITGFDAAFSKRFAARLNLKADISKRREAEDEEPRATVDETIATYSPSADFTFTTDKGLEIFGGVMDQITAAYTENVSSANGESETRFHKASVLARRFGVVRRAGGVWSGGFYYVMGAEAGRQIKQTAFDGSGTTATDTVFVPSQIGIMGNFKAGQGLWDFELAFVQARGMGPKDDRGNTTLSDHFTARVGTLYDLGGLGLRASVFHKTQSYANNAFVTMDTIPVTSLKLLLLLGTAENNSFIGLIGAYGRDGQSLPEFNAKYQMFGTAVTGGVTISL